MQYALGTFLAPEEHAYPGDSLTRKGAALCPDGRVRRVWAKVADTFFTVPAVCRIRGTYTRGFLTVETASGSDVPLDGEPILWYFTPAPQVTP